MILKVYKLLHKSLSVVILLLTFEILNNYFSTAQPNRFLLFFLVLHCNVFSLQETYSFYKLEYKRDIRMNTQKIDCHCTTAEWLDLLAEVSFLKASYYQGHAYIYINAAGKADCFFSQEAAEKKNFHWKLTIDDILHISQQLFNNYKQCKLEDYFILQHAFEFMDNEASDAHLLIEKHLCLLTKQCLQPQYHWLQKKLECFKELGQELNDQRFSKVYTKLLKRVEKWNQESKKGHLDGYQIWKEQEEKLACLLLEIERLVYFTDKILFLVRQKQILYQLMHLHFPAFIHPTSIKQIDLKLERLINRILYSFITHKEEFYHKELDTLDADLEKLQFAVMSDYQNQPHYQPELLHQAFELNPIKANPSSLQHTVHCSALSKEKVYSFYPNSTAKF